MQKYSALIGLMPEYGQVGPRKGNYEQDTQGRLDDLFSGVVGETITCTEWVA